MFEAFTKVAEPHGFPADIPSMERGVSLATFMINHPSFYGSVAESEGKVVGSSFLDERDEIRSVLVITVDPHFQGGGVGRQLMDGLLKRGKGSLGIRLVQDPHNPLALSLYTSLGFDVKELLAMMIGRPSGPLPSGFEVRRLHEEDIPQCARLCREVHGVERTNELRDAIKSFSPHVALRKGRITAYATDMSIWQVAHGVADTEEDMEALILGMSHTNPSPVCFLLPTSMSGFFRWSLTQGLKVVKPMTIMSMGMYQQPRGCFFSSVAY